MGLGKTVEVLALILGNPSTSTSTSTFTSTSPHPARTVRSDVRENESLAETKATLIVVPQTLIGKLRNELIFLKFKLTKYI